MFKKEHQAHIQETIDFVESLYLDDKEYHSRVLFVLSGAFMTYFITSIDKKVNLKIFDLITKQIRKNIEDFNNIKIDESPIS